MKALKLNTNPFKICRKKLQSLKEEQEKILKDNPNVTPQEALEIAKENIKNNS